MDDELDIEIQHVTFRPDELIEITYTEKRDVAEKVVLVKTIVLEAVLLDKDDLLDTLKNLQSFVDEGLLRLRLGDPAGTE